MKNIEEHLTRNLTTNMIFFTLRAILILFLLFTTDIIVVQYFIDFLPNHTMLNVLKVADIVWVILITALINLFLANIVFIYLELKKGTEIPNLIKTILYFLLYFLAFVIIYQEILNFNIASLLASLGVFAMVVGFALQSNISNIFSGIAMSIDKTIEIGDWIRFEGLDEGIVLDLNWRTTKVRCRDGKLVYIPNCLAADKPLINYSKSDQLLQLIVVDVDLRYEPKDVLDALMSSMYDVNFIIDFPEPEVGIKSIDEWSVKYKLIYYINDYTKRFAVMQDIWQNIWRNFDKYGIEPSTQKEEIILSKPDKTKIFRNIKNNLSKSTQKKEVQQSIDIAEAIKLEDLNADAKNNINEIKAAKKNKYNSFYDILPPEIKSTIYR
jgi:branched-chain amino acid transport system substrate-binding protein